MSVFAVLLATVVSASCPEKGLVFMGGETPQFAVSGVSANGAAWSVSDWRGQVQATGRLAADGTLDVQGLPPGYWTLAVEDADALCFTTVVDPSTRRSVVNSAYAADSAFSWMCIASAYRADFTVDLAEHLARLIHAAGITQTRERFCWEDVQKAKDGTISWGRYLRNANLLASKGIKTSWHNANSPTFVGGKGGGWGSQSLARDLVALRDFSEQVGRDLGATLADFEYLNEPDLGFSPWDATAQYKAASVGFRAAKSGVPTTNFSMCLGVDFNYDNLVFDNDMAKYIDIFNIHNYSHLQEYDSFNARIHSFLDKRRIGDYPILISESGCEAEGEATQPTDVDNLKAQTPEQEMIVADFIPKAQIKRQFGGVWRNHFFIFASYHERSGRKDWGIVRRDGTARPGLAAFAALTAELDGHRILGRVETSGGVEAYLYDCGDGRKALAFWGNGSFAVGCTGTARLVDWCGTPRQVNPTDGQVTLTAEEHVSYLTGALEATIAKEATPAGTLRLHDAQADEDLDVVIRVDFPETDFDLVDGFTAVETKNAGEGVVNIEIWNLSDQVKRGQLTTENGVLVGWPTGEIVLPARGVYSHEATLKPIVGLDGEAKWMLSGVFNGKKTSRFAAPVRDFATALSTLRKVTVDANDAANWTKNNSALQTTFTPDGESMRIDMSWVTADPTVSTSDRWAYNKIRVPAAAQDTVKYVVFEIRSEQDKVENNFTTANVYAYGKGRTDRIVCNSPMKEWTKIHVAIPKKTDAPVEAVGIGGNPVGKELSLWIRNVEFYCVDSTGVSRIVAAGTTETITEDLTIDGNLSVAGTLNIVGAKVKLTSGHKLTVKAGSNGPWANLNLKDAQLVLPTDNWDVFPLVGENDRYGQITLDNSTLTANRMVLANNTPWCRAYLTLTNNSSVVLSGGPLTMNSKFETIAEANTRKSWVTLYEGCRLQAVYLTACDNLRCGVYFAGGTLAVRRLIVQDSCKVFLKGINGHPIKLETVLDTNDRSPAMFTFASGTQNARVLLGAESPADLTPVDCGFTKTGMLDAPFVLDGYQDRVLFNYTGATRIETAGTTLTAADQLPAGGDVHVGGAATLRIGGFSQTFGSFTGGGLVSNNTETAAVITLRVPEGETKVYSADVVKGPVSLVKTGGGTLVAQKSTFDGVTVQEGAVEFADPRVTGYPEYQFIVDRPYGNTYSGLAYNELDFYDGERNVTTPMAKSTGMDPYGMHKNLFDHDPMTFLWIDCTYNDNPIGNRGQVNTYYDAPFKMTSFTWTTFENTNPSVDWCRDPGAWRLRGRYHGGEWETLHSMTNKGYALEARRTETEKFHVTYPQLPIVSLGGAKFSGGSLTLPADAAAKVPSGETFDATGSSVVLSALAVDCAAENGTVVGGTVAASGRLYLTNVPASGLRVGARIPLTFDGTVAEAGVARWQVFVNGVLQQKRWAAFENGYFTIAELGFSVIIR